jgi:hypothetical protein
LQSVNRIQQDQWLKEKLEYTKGVIRSRKVKERQHNGQQLEDKKGVIRRKSIKQ